MRAEPSSFRILVVDDDLMVLEVIEAILTSVGHDVSVTDDPRTALELIWREDFDVVITDLGMPELDGWSVARQVKAKNAVTPVIVVTGWGVQYEKSDLLRNGVDLLFAKPVGRQALIGAVEELVTHSIRRSGRHRRHKRFPGKRGESVRVSLLSPDSPTQLAELIDISRSGLSFRYNERENSVGALLRIEIVSREGFELDLSPSQIVYDMMLEQSSSSSEMKSVRRCGIEFENLNGEQVFQLETFIRSRASDDI